ncbi:MAG TPA: ABC transporter ATP-binding protein [Candidatus Paceibacterota bacterium]|nr:ABC transporter ATP-binding protein [Candidatus Paceibacterota bacterium]
MIEVKDLKKDYADEGEVTSALRGVSFTINKGDFVSIMGPSGSGKSTLVQILSFLDRPTGGTYTFLDKATDGLSDVELAHIRNKSIGFVFQSFNLLTRLTCYENVEIPLIYSAVPVAARKKMIEDAVRSVGLEEKLYVETAKLSGGQKQRIAIARALVNDPDIIFADEPTGNLDSVSGAQVMSILDGLNHNGRTIILVTHETATAEFADRIIYLRDGVIESDKPVKNPRHSMSEFVK